MKQRITTGILAGAGFLVLLYLGGAWFALIISVLALIGYYEFISMMKLRHTDPASIIGYLSIAFLVIPRSQESHALGIFSFETGIWAMMVLFLLATVVTKNRTNVHDVSILFLGTLYIGTGFHFMGLTRSLEHGLFWTLLVFACIWATDSGAYFTGWAIGKRLLWPSISPKKTVEGAVGGILFSVVTAIGFSLYSPDLLSVRQALLIAVLASIFSQLGDFVESALKRSQGVKDSGTILPGHGGILDRVDSWLFVFPMVHLFALLS
ncbi:phosphatidate cytidylyltransferase [Ferviditalea candida]|uniref:Phosphatidate cytidylyltransferase n=1 Tax=Ferviditalea candida TaxID=3108399 RepID=A0ABU5ZF40_9BACL|nr:phosphatidate cytidylyltransferase [Paenibacillaceae bacterium T2]